MSKLEEIARAICAANDTSKWCGCGGKCDDMQNRARAAIEATKNPTEEMLKGAYRAQGGVKDQFNAMINTALEEK